MIYIEMVIRKMISLIKLFLVKIRYLSKIKFSLNESISLTTTFRIRKKGRVYLGQKVSTRRNVEFNANDNGIIEIGDNSFFNNNCIIASHSKIEIGNDCSFGPNVVIYDHDHDFKTFGGKKEGKYKTSPIKIGNNVWVGANAIILRGVAIGDNSVVAAGTIVKENINSNVIYHSKIENTEKLYQREN